MKKLLCLIGLHDLGRVQYLESLGIFYHQCERCGTLKKSFWDRTIGNDPVGDPIRDAVLWIAHLVHIERWGFRIDLHKMTQADRENCFHSHPAEAIRLVLGGGYEEETLWRVCCLSESCNLDLEYDGFCRSQCHTDGPVARTARVEWKPGNVGRIRPTFVHRISRLLRGPSYSLWIRFRCTHPILLCGVSRGGHYVEEQLSFNQEESS